MNSLYRTMFFVPGNDPKKIMVLKFIVLIVLFMIWKTQYQFLRKTVPEF